MNRNEYISHPDVSKFITFFTELCCSDKAIFQQSYKPKRKSEPEFNIHQFKDALRNYSWMGDDYYATSIKIELLTQDIESALKKGDETAALKAALRIYDWGGVMNEASVRWLLDNHDKYTLIKAIQKAVHILTTNDDSEISQFEGNKILRSDSATTKVFSFIAHDRSIIYDDRVGAALGAVAKAFLKQHGYNATPELLNFMRGSTSRRNPSDTHYKFSLKKAGANHALSNLRANWILSEVAKEWKSPLTASVSSSVRELESCLFMIGYDVTTIAEISLS